jgi:hypothetical protein
MGAKAGQFYAEVLGCLNPQDFHDDGQLISAIGGSSLDLETNGVPNGSQTVLNLKDGSGITITDDGLGGVTIAASAATAQPVDIGVFNPGVGTNAQILLRLPMNRALTFPINAPNSNASASANATGNTTYTLKKNGVSFATVLFATGTAVGVWTQAAQATFAAGDVLEIDGPGTADATLANVGINLAGTR